MNFDEALQAHVNWKMKLSHYLRKPDGSLKAREIEGDKACALGKWIHGEGSAYASVPEFGKLKAEHARFHQAAADVVRRADDGVDVKDETALGSQSAFGKASKAVVGAILALKSKQPSPR